MVKDLLLVEKYRPETLDGYIGNETFISDINKWINENHIPNLLLYGPPGTGKTTAAKLIVKNIQCDYLYLNCSDENGIDVIRDKVKQFASSMSFKPIKVVILDEAEFLSLSAQAALRNIIETFSVNTRFIFTCNYVERIIEPLRSRLVEYELTAPNMKQLAKHLQKILDTEYVRYELKDLATIIKKTYPDIRKALNTIQGCINNGVLKLDGKLIVSSNVTQLIIDEVENKSFNKIRQIIADNNITEFTGLYRALYEEYNTPEASIIIEEYLNHSSTIPDKEICFMACVSKLISV
jgi:replication factor C small subunit